MAFTKVSQVECYNRHGKWLYFYQLTKGQSQKLREGEQLTGVSSLAILCHSLLAHGRHGNNNHGNTSYTEN